MKLFVPSVFSIETLGQQKFFLSGMLLVAACSCLILAHKASIFVGKHFKKFVFVAKSAEGRTNTSFPADHFIHCSFSKEEDSIGDVVVFIQLMLN